MANKNGDDWANAIAYMYSNKYPPTKTYRGIDLGQGPNNYIPTKVSSTKPEPCYGCGKATYVKYDGVYYCDDCHEPLGQFTTINLSVDRVLKDQAWNDLKKIQYCGYKLDNTVLGERTECYNCDGPLDAPYPGEGDNVRIACWKCRGQEGQGNFWDRPDPWFQRDVLYFQRNLRRALSKGGLPPSYLGYGEQERACYFCARKMLESSPVDAGEQFPAHAGCLLAAKIEFSKTISDRYTINSNPVKIEDQKHCYCCGSTRMRISSNNCGSFRICIDCYWTNTRKSKFDTWDFQPFENPESPAEAKALWETPEFLASYTGRPVEEFIEAQVEALVKNIDLDEPFVATNSTELDSFRMSDEDYMRYLREAMVKIFQLDASYLSKMAPLDI